MAPDLAIDKLQDLAPNSLILDPMTGSGTVVRHASMLGHRAVGTDLDPLAVLMSRVSTTPVADGTIERLAAEAVLRAERAENIVLPWIDEDVETQNFVNFWFGPEQRGDLRKLAHALSPAANCVTPDESAALDVLRIALSRIIVTKKVGASLAWDVSHSRPHKVMDTSDFDVMKAFKKSVEQVRQILANEPPAGNTDISRCDARALTGVLDGSIDAVITSPPYLNAIDYMRGHRLSLVWLGHRLTDLRYIRSNSIGAERGPDDAVRAQQFSRIQNAMCVTSDLARKHQIMVARYAEDLHNLLHETNRVLRQQGQAIFVVGNSCLKGTFIRNSDGVREAALINGLSVQSIIERELPQTSRYLPMPVGNDAPLGKRMRTETILSFIKP